MRKTLFSLFLLPLCSLAQTNLVPNSGFEEYKQLPCACMQGDMHDYLVSWDAANAGTSDYITDLAAANCYADCKADDGQGIQSPHGGHGMAFFYNYYPSGDYREYVSVTLNRPLVQGKNIMQRCMFRLLIILQWQAIILECCFIMFFRNLKAVM
jgi:hypothetical protein